MSAQTGLPKRPSFPRILNSTRLKATKFWSPFRKNNRKPHAPVSPFKDSDPTSSEESIAIRDVTKHTTALPFEAQTGVNTRPDPKFVQEQVNNASHETLENTEISVVGPSSLILYPTTHPSPFRVTLTAPDQELDTHTALIRKPPLAGEITLSPKDSILVALKPFVQGHEPSGEPYGEASLTRNFPHIDCERHINFSLSMPPVIVHHHPLFDTDPGCWQKNTASLVACEGTDIVAVSPYQSRPPAGARVGNNRKSSRQESTDDAENQRKRHRRNDDGAGGKSGRTPGGGGSSSGGGGGGLGSGGGTGSLNEARTINGRRFACPYYRLDRIKYRACLFRHNLTGTNYVKQHLQRSHSPQYCPTCGEVFSREDRCNIHIRAEGCERREFSLDGMSATQRDGLDSLSRGGNEVERWFRLWDYLFPNVPRPSTPYVDDIYVEVLDLVLRGGFEKGGLDRVLSAHLGPVAEQQMQSIRHDVWKEVENYTRELINQGRENAPVIQDHSAAMIPSQSASSSGFEVVSEDNLYAPTAGSQEAAPYPSSEAHSSSQPPSQLVSETSRQGYNFHPGVGPSMFFQGSGGGGFSGHGNAHLHVGYTAPQVASVTSHYNPNNTNPIGASPSQPRSYGVGYGGQGNAHAFPAQAFAQGFQGMPAFLEDWGPPAQGDDNGFGPDFEFGNGLDPSHPNFSTGLEGFQGVMGDVFEDGQDTQDHS